MQNTPIPYFTCENCGFKVATNDDVNIGTKNRNHCPKCGYSKHVDNKDGDRSAGCGSLMKPVGLMFKSKGELSLVHVCTNLSCNKVSRCRLAGDDDVQMLLDVFEGSLALDETVKVLLAGTGFVLAGAEDSVLITDQLFL